MYERTQQEEVDRNYKAFKGMLENLIKTDRGRFALLHDAKLVACFDTNRDAQQAASKLIEGKPYSVQKVTDRKVDLGYISYVGVLR